MGNEMVWRFIWIQMISDQPPVLFGFFLLQTTIAIIDCFPIASMQIEVTTQLTTCCYYRFEGGDRGGSFGLCRHTVDYPRFAVG